MATLFMQHWWELERSDGSDHGKIKETSEGQNALKCTEIMKEFNAERAVEETYIIQGPIDEKMMIPYDKNEHFNLSDKRPLVDRNSITKGFPDCASYAILYNSLNLDVNIEREGFGAKIYEMRYGL